jgi:phosphoribosylformylglycinamidine (FGAM) synthase-like amidotransferase family enzyme
MLKGRQGKELKKVVFVIFAGGFTYYDLQRFLIDAW